MADQESKELKVGETNAVADGPLRKRMDTIFNGFDKRLIWRSEMVPFVVVECICSWNMQLPRARHLGCNELFGCWW